MFPSHLQHHLPSRGIQAFRLKMKTGFRELELLGFPDRMALKWPGSLFAVLLLVPQCSKGSYLLLHFSGVALVQLYGILSSALLETGVSFFGRGLAELQEGRTLVRSQLLFQLHELLRMAHTQHLSGTVVLREEEFPVVLEKAAGY